MNLEATFRDAIVELSELLDGVVEEHIAEAKAKSIKTLTEKAHTAEIVSMRLSLQATAIKLRELNLGGEKE